MLILSRKLGESIVIDGRIHVKIVRLDGDVVKVGIEAPADVPVHRREVYEEIQRSNQAALTRQSIPLPRLPITKPISRPGNHFRAANNSSVEVKTEKTQLL